MIEVLLGTAVLSVLSAILCGKLQYKRAREGSPKVWVLPCCTGGLVLLSGFCCAAVRTFALISWALLLVAAAIAFLTTMIAWWMGK